VIEVQSYAFRREVQSYAFRREVQSYAFRRDVLHISLLLVVVVGSLRLQA
jgi:hypothetical protein